MLRPNQKPFEQHCLFKFAALLITKDMTPEDAFKLCDTDVGSMKQITSTELQQFIENLDAQFEQKEMYSLFRYLDNGGSGRINEDSFISEV